jgi:hypothetical protein
MREWYGYSKTGENRMADKRPAIKPRRPTPGVGLAACLALLTWCGCACSSTAASIDPPALQADLTYDDAGNPLTLNPTPHNRKIRNISAPGRDRGGALDGAADAKI